MCRVNINKSNLVGTHVGLGQRRSSTPAAGCCLCCTHKFVCVPVHTTGKLGWVLMPRMCANQPL